VRETLESGRAWGHRHVANRPIDTNANRLERSLGQERIERKSWVDYWTDFVAKEATERRLELG